MEKTYYLGRFNLSANYSTYQEKERLIASSLDSTVIIKHKQFKYRFSGVERVKLEDMGFFVGSLLKYSRNKSHEVVEESGGTVNQIEVDNEVIGTAKFVLEVKTGLIAYTVPARQISQLSFLNRFTELIEEANDNFFVEATIETIEERGDLMERLRSMNRIDEIKINLHPSNPSSAKIWETVDKRIQGLNAAKYSQQYEAKKGGPSLQTDNQIIQSIAMAEDGYGTAQAKGINQDGQQVRYSTTDNPESFKLENDNVTPSILVESVLPFIKRVISRINRRNGDDRPSPRGIL